ncbi:hypothetical protein PHYSODRAFT_301724 [Phytophthora sojae]|uniref:Uncharacterized protein n=1 Tax=Phytophthora sojae (strain P6497) TaxID=1094619 RepID=G4ZMD7_PHYSP|nr:hypothetical protein PHYSODRAFT_301724 [Phytophthora sojae]EGZ14990.1 hypothetical protein PHYSODRAFT_301724 [Phytophthora sojae]|eukprot:XP_009528739.1 hypothetical protein PHYSODRAFT_301724 [Phytophthora sojae]
MFSSYAVEADNLNTLVGFRRRVSLPRCVSAGRSLISDCRINQTTPDSIVSNMSPSHKREGPDPEPDAEHDTEFGTEHDAEHDTEFGTVANTEPDAEHDTDAQHRGNSCRWAAGPN